MTGVTREIAAKRDGGEWDAPYDSDRLRRAHELQNAYSTRVELPCDSEPHGEDAAVMAAHEPPLGWAYVGINRVDGSLHTADGRSWSPGAGVAGRDYEAEAGVMDLAGQIDHEATGSLIREFCDVLGIRVPRDMERAVRAFVALGLIGRGDG